MSKIVCGHCNQPVSEPVNLWVGGQPYHDLCLSKATEIARLKTENKRLLEALRKNAEEYSMRHLPPAPHWREHERLD